MKFYRLEYKDMLNRVAYLASEEITNQKAGEIFYGNLKISSPLKVKHISGKKWPDMLISMHVTIPFVSDKIIKLLEENNFTGWSKFEIEIENKPVEITTQYYGISVSGRCKNNLKTIAKDKKIVGWDGLDIFTMEGTSIIYITENVFNCLSNKKEKLTNLYFESFDDYLLYYIDERAYFKKRFG